jgi:broad-specificity NMP kinase
MFKNDIIYITGMPGTGKSAVCAELKKRGFRAFDTDHDNIAYFYNNTTNEPLIQHVSSEERTPEWRSRYTWKAKREVVEQLRYQDTEGPVFLCGVTSNDAEELWDLFAKVFALVIEDEEELKKRISERSEDGFGKNPHELATLMRWRLTATEDYRKLNAIIVDSSQPINEVTDYILERTFTTSP